MMASETLKQQIANSIAVGLRKGVDGEGSALYYNTLNPGFFNSNPRIGKIANKHVQNIGEAIEDLVRTKCNKETASTVSREQIAQVMKEAACTLIQTPKSKSQHKLTAKNEGIAILRELSPVEFEDYRPYRFLSLPVDEHGNQPIYIQEPRRENSSKDIWHEAGETKDWENFRRLGEDYQTYIGAVLLKMVEEFPEVKAKYAHLLTDQSPQYAINLQKAAQGMTDEGWDALVAWVLYVLEEN